jgi:hypothetical protein
MGKHHLLEHRNTMEGTIITGIVRGALIQRFLI